MDSVNEEEKKNSIEKAREGWYGGKPGPKVFSSGSGFVKYWMQRLEKERTDIDSFIGAYAKQPFYIRCELAEIPEMQQVLKALVLDQIFGVANLKSSQWTALSKLLDMRKAKEVEEERTKRKAINKDNMRKVDQKAQYHEVSVELEDDGEA